MVSLFDWHNSLDAKETHKIITAGIMKACLENIQPFEEMNSTAADMMTYVCLKTSGYGFRDLISIENYYRNTKADYRNSLESIDQSGDQDLTEWLEYFTEALASEVSTVSQNIKLLAKDTKIAKATGRTKVSTRQERIIEYMQDYGMLQNKDFSRIFPDISEDTVLRDLKSLIDKELYRSSGVQNHLDTA